MHGVKSPWLEISGLWTWGLGLDNSIHDEVLYVVYFAEMLGLFSRVKVWGARAPSYAPAWWLLSKHAMETHVQGVKCEDVSLCSSLDICF